MIYIEIGAKIIKKNIATEIPGAIFNFFSSLKRASKFKITSAKLKIKKDIPALPLRCSGLSMYFPRNIKALSIASFLLL